MPSLRALLLGSPFRFGLLASALLFLGAFLRLLLLPLTLGLFTLSRFLLGPLLRQGLLAQPFALLGLSLRFGFLPNALLVLGPPFDLGLQLAAFVRREPRLAQSLDDLAAKALDGLPEGGRVDGGVAEGTPIDILAFGDDRKHRIGAPVRFVQQSGDRDPENREDEIAAPERVLAGDERGEFEFAIVAADRPRRHDRDEEHRLLDRFRDLRFPILARRDGLLVLPQAEVSPGAPELRAELTLDGVPQRRERASERLVVLARVAEEADEFGKLRYRRHRALRSQRPTITCRSMPASRKRPATSGISLGDLFGELRGPGAAGRQLEARGGPERFEGRCDPRLRQRQSSVRLQHQGGWDDPQSPRQGRACAPGRPGLVPGSAGTPDGGRRRDRVLGASSLRLMNAKTSFC